MINSLKNLCITGAFFACITSAGAALSGEIHISSSGSTAAIDFSANTVTMTPSAPSANAIVSYATGDFAPLGPVGLIPSTTVVYENFTYDSLPLGGYTPIWETFGGGTAWFDLLSITSISEDPSLTSLSLAGTGTLHYLADSQAGVWTFSASQSGSDFQFGSTNATSAVPDGGGTVALFGLSLFGLQIFRRRFSQK